MNNPGLDLSLDSAGAVGIYMEHTYVLSSVCEYLFMFPLLILCDRMMFENTEAWTYFDSID
jgi:hypothetical protein